MRCRYCGQELDDGQHFRCSEVKRMIGKIKTLNTEKGYGFIKDDNGGEFFFHMSGLVGCTMRELVPGTKVSFEKVNSPKGLRAENVQLVD